MVLIIPSIENRFEEPASILIMESEIETSLEKHISVCRNFSPNFTYGS